MSTGRRLFGKMPSSANTCRVGSARVITVAMIAYLPCAERRKRLLTIHDIVRAAGRDAAFFAREPRRIGGHRGPDGGRVSVAQEAGRGGIRSRVRSGASGPR